MSRFRGLQGLTIGLTFLAMLLMTFLALLGSVGCARPDGPPSDGGAMHADQHQVPFQDGDGASKNPDESSAAKDQGPGNGTGTDPNSTGPNDIDPNHGGSNSPNADLSNSLNSGTNPGSGLPFHDSQNLPAGTLLTVRLKNPISADNPGANAKFEAVVDEPVVIAGNPLIPRGVTVAGRVESAGTSNVRHNRGYVRLALDSMQFTGANLPIQTSSLFVRGNAVDSAMEKTGIPPAGTPSAQSPSAIRVEKGRRLTFRLTEPAYLAVSQHKPADH